jgi:hypothetical protein
MKLEEMIAKLERIENQFYEGCLMLSDLRVLILGLYDDRDWWREKAQKLVADDFDQFMYEHVEGYQLGDCKRLWCGICNIWMERFGNKYTCPVCGLNIHIKKGEEDE